MSPELKLTVEEDENGWFVVACGPEEGDRSESARFPDKEDAILLMRHAGSIVAATATHISGSEDDVMVVRSVRKS